jgi:glycosyltransferase involved in cell wall biosynthesis
MIRKVAIVHTDFRIYWPARLHALRELFAEKGIALLVIEISGKGSPYAFAGASIHENTQWSCLFRNMEMERIDSAEAVQAVLEQLDKFRPDIVIAGAIAFPGGAAAARWGVINKTPVVIFDDARLEDVQRAALVNYVKKSIYSTVSAVLIPAPSHDSTYMYYGFSEDQIYYGLNCIDNRFFLADPASVSGMLQDGIRPRQYFLAVGRQISKKHMISLLHAFKHVADHSAMKAWSLVFIGDGPDHGQLMADAGDLMGDRVIFLPFMAQTALRRYFTDAGALVLPSLGETWGLVVNEAMASGLPVLVSDKCGCATTLVEDGVNGFVFNPEEQSAIENVLVTFAKLSPEKRSEMGDASSKIISDWGLDRFCRGMWNACVFADASREKKGSIAGQVFVRFWNGRYRPV